MNSISGAGTRKGRRGTDVSSTARSIGSRYVVVQYPPRIKRKCTWTCSSAPRRQVAPRVGGVGGEREMAPTQQRAPEHPHGPPHEREVVAERGTADIHEVERQLQRQ